MNPRTLEFVPEEALNKLMDSLPPVQSLDERAAEVRQLLEKQAGGSVDNWVRFQVGQEFDLNGVRFYISKIRRHRIEIRPVAKP